MSQEHILVYDWHDRERMYKVRDNIAITPDIQFQLYLENPLEYGYHLYSIADDGIYDYSSLIN